MRTLLVLAFLVTSAAFFSGASGIDNVDAQQPDFAAAIAAQEKHTPGLLNVPGIVGTGVGVSARGEAVIRVYTATPGVVPPQALDNVPVERVVTGRVDARCYQDECPRPVPLGVSVGHPSITAGTIGARVTDGTNVYVLSNNHVLANSNNASIGDSALQPGPYDGGTDPADRIGTLAEFVSINFSGGNNTVDAAIAVTTESQVTNVTFGGDKPTNTPAVATVGLDVKKEGRTTGITTGDITEVNVIVNVCYQPRGPFMCAKAARFIDQFAVVGASGNFSAGGDSGSLIVTQDGNDPVGLLFAGGGSTTFANQIDLVLAALDVEIDDSDDDPAPGNNPPNASFSFACIDLACNFDASGSSDGDGSIVSYAWDFGDGSDGAGVTTPHTYAIGDTYEVVLTVTDDDGAIDAVTQSVVVTAPPPGDGITLDVTGYKVRGIQNADLTWSGATSTNVDVKRNGVTIATTLNDGAYTDNIGARGGGSYTYEVCEAGTSTCSSAVTITF